MKKYIMLIKTKKNPEWHKVGFNGAPLQVMEILLLYFIKDDTLTSMVTGFKILRMDKQ
jgi:hypothetical protein